MVTLSVVVSNLHRLQLLQTSLLCDLILTLVGVVLEVTNVGDVANIAYLIARSLQVAEQQVECNRWAGMSQMGITINGRTTYIHAYTALIDGLKRLLAT